MMKRKNLEMRAKKEVEIPKVFWKYYDLYRRKEISLEEYSQKSDLPEDEILQYLYFIKKQS